MSVLGGNPLLLGSASGSSTDPTFPVQRSVRLRSSASAYFNRTPAVVPTNYTKTTISFWVKNLNKPAGEYSTIYGQGDYDLGTPANRNGSGIYFVNDRLYITEYASGTTRLLKESNALFRDPAAWYHFVISIDTTLPNANDRCVVWCNGVQLTWLSATNPTQNINLYFQSTLVSYIGTTSFANPSSKGRFLDGYLTEVNFIDGQALTPSSFGGYNSGTGVWEPRQYTGTYGTNGFYLNFQDNSAATAAAIGKDSSGNGNNWTPNNISVTAGVTYDSMVDVPTLTSATNANFAVGNPLNADGSTWSSGNLNFSLPNSTNNAQGTVSVTSGKWYWEVVYSAQANGTGVQEIGLRTRWTSGVVYAPDGTKYVNGTNSAYGATYTVGDIIGVALDMDASTVTFYKNNTSQGSISLSGSGCVNATFTTSAGGGSTSTGSVNFGQRPFTYTPPSGFKSLNTYNLPEPTIPSGDDYHKVYTYTGNGGGLQVGEIQKPLSLYNLDRSLRFKGTNSYFDKVFAAGSNNTKGTLSMWIKRGKLAVQQELVRFGTTGTLFSGLFFSASDTLNFVRLNSTYQGFIQPTKVFKDPNAWIHIVVGWDTTQATAADRVKLYINGIQETVLTTATYPTQNLDMYWFTAGTHNIGRYPVGGNYFDGYMAEFHAVDGTMLTPSDFGQFDGNYYWTPKDYTGSYGTNGWHLDFEDFSAVTAAAIGKDVSGLGNNFTPYNFNLTTPANTNTSWDSMVDVPTQTSTDVANFATFNPLYNATTLTNANLTSSATTNTGVVATLEIPPTGLFYWEITATTVVAGGNTLVGMIAINQATTVRDGTVAGIRVVARSDGLIQVDGTTLQSGLGAWSSGDVIGCSYNATTNSLQFYRNNSTFGTAVTPTSGYTFVPWCCSVVSGTSVFNINFGQRPFRYTPPTGFKSLNSFNIAEVTGDLESPDFVWIKSRSAATGHALFNSVTGVGKYLSSNATTGETTDVNSLIQFNKNGFLLGNAAIVNTSAATYVASAWKKGVTQGFDIVTYTGDGNANRLLSHSLGAMPAMIIVKARNASITGGAWPVWHKSIANSNTLYLDQNYGSSTYVNRFDPTGFSQTQWKTGTNGGAGSELNSSGNTHIAYLFAEIAGFSKFGSYTGSTSLPFVYLGFRPKYVLIKRTDTTGDWQILDSSRSQYNTADARVWADLSLAEVSNTGGNTDFLSNGFKIRNSNGDDNTAGGTYIYAAFAENPFKYSLAR